MALVVGPFEEEEEGICHRISVASDVVKVEGKDPATLGSLGGSGRVVTFSIHFVGTCSLVLL